MTGHLISMPAWDSMEGQAMRARLQSCPLCDGEGIIETEPAGDAWAWCLPCKGAGMNLDGEGEANPAMYEEFPVDFYRSCQTAYPIGDRSTHRQSGALDQAALARLRTHVGVHLPGRAVLLPAVRNVDASFVAIGPSQQRIIDEFWRPRTRYAGEMLRIQGFIDRHRGHFLNSARAMVRARHTGLVDTRATTLRGEQLFYRELVPLMVVRGTI